VLTPTPIETQLAALRADALKVLVVGAGVAGIALAQLLRGQGLHPVLIERAVPDGSPGYMLALMPMVDPVIDELEARSAYLDRSAALARFRLRSHVGRPVREDPLADLMARYGDYRGLGRGDLLNVLSSAGGSVSYQTTVTAIRQDQQQATATVASPSGEREITVDVIIAADGLHSQTRNLILDKSAVEVVDTGWGGWVAWADADSETDLAEELWGAGFFVGSYPVLRRLGVIVCGPADLTRDGSAALVAYVRRQLDHPEGRVAASLDAITAADDQYYWALTGCRARTWSIGRVGLLGDAAAGFLPTAGIGAGMALESARQLAHELAATDSEGAPEALRRYEVRQRPRVEAAQDNSRLLARLVLRRSRLVATLRDLVMARVSAKVALGPIQKLLAEAGVDARA
jgi:2-polyprenyl-6-methoxyphenol hydroxylase-like FAD-dependent oxidoreductase